MTFNKKIPLPAKRASPTQLTALFSRSILLPRTTNGKWSGSLGEA